MRDNRALVLGCLLLGACAVGEDYEKPDVKFADSWQAVKSQSFPTSAGKQKNKPMVVIDIVQPDYLKSPFWWERFNDPVLTRLIKKARAENNDIKVAEMRVQEARGSARAALGVMLPQLGTSATASRIGPSAGTLGDSTGQTGLTATWDLDLFGGDRRSLEAAQAEVQATEADRDKVLLTVIANMAGSYVQLRTLQQERILIVKNLAMQKDTLEITLGQRSAGAVSDLEVARAHAQVVGTQARLPEVDAAIAAAFNQISILSGEAPHQLESDLTKPAEVPLVPPQIVVGTPVEAIERRPDVHAAERRLAETTALSGAAFAQLFPKISLQSFFGSEWSHVYGFTTPFNVTAGAIMPLLDWGRIRGQIDTADARQQEFFVTYQQTILLGLQEIENTLAAYMNEQNHEMLLEENVGYETKAAEVARAQYKAGATTQLDLLTAENDLLTSENDLIMSRGALATDLIKLYVALGEPWEDKAESGENSK